MARRSRPRRPVADDPTATKPKGEGRHPALFFIQGIGLYSIDNPVGPLGSHKIIVDDFARRGFVTLRVDKPGCGDSEGGPARDVDFDTELDGYRQALKMLKARGDVDTDRVFIFGHSMGGVMAPLLAAGVPTVQGVIVFCVPSRRTLNPNTCSRTRAGNWSWPTPTHPPSIATCGPMRPS